MIQILFILTLVVLPLLSCQNKAVDTTPELESITGNATAQHPKNPYYSRSDTTKLTLTDTEWKKVLPNEVYAIARNKGTERAFTGKYWNHTGKGTYYCAACGNALFRSEGKFASECGWPSFFEPIRKSSVVYQRDTSYSMDRIEVVCGRCDGHLGHLFDDGPPPTGKRYCMNSIMLDFEASNSFGLD